MSYFIADTGELAGVDESFHDILAGSLLAVKLSNPCLLAGSIRLAIHQSVVEHLYELIVAGVLLDVLVAEDEALGNFFTAVCTARKLIYPCSQTLLDPEFCREHSHTGVLRKLLRLCTPEQPALHKRLRTGSLPTRLRSQRIPV